MDSLLDPSRFRPDRLPSPAFMPRDDDFVELLRSADFDVRLQTLNRVINLSKRDPDWFTRFAKKGELFKNLDRILMDDRWEVQHQCIKFLVEAMPTFGNCLEYCVCYVMPNLIPKLGSSKITVRKVSVQAIQAFLKSQPGALGSVLKMLVNYLLTSPDRTTKSEVLQEVPALFITEVMQSNWFALVDCLTQWLATADKETIERIVVVTKKLEVYIGNDAFSRLLQNLSANQQRDYNKCSSNVTIVIDETEKQPQQTTAARATIKLHSGERRFRFGIVPSFISSMVLDDTNSSARISGLEKLKQIIEKITPEEVARLVPHLHSYLIGLSHVLTDLNFKVVVLALDVVRITVNRLKSHMEAHLQQVVSLLSKHFGNQKAVIKQLIMMTCMDLFQNLNPKAVVGVLCVYLENRNSRMREEVVNILTAALMIISASKINFTAVINVMVPLLMDPKRRVRLAAFEQLSVVAYLMNGKIDPLLRAVRDAELRYKANGLYNAVMARIHRHLLPRIRYDGLIEYSTPPITDSSFNVKESELRSADNVDLLWILHAGGENHDRLVSPVSVVANIAKSLNDFRKESDKTSRYQAEDNAKCLISYTPMDRMNSDDQIIRRHEGKAIANPNSSTNSWHAPPKRNNSIVNEDRASSAVVNRLTGKLSEPNIILDKKRPNGVRRAELNNNIPMDTNKISKGTMNMLKARSEGNLSDERENSPPINYDDVPIRPAKNGKYLDDYPLSPPDRGSLLVKKSTSHHSLPITSTHVSLKNTQSVPTKKPHCFLKSSSSCKVKPAAPNKPVSREVTKTQMNGASKTGNGITSNNSTGGSVQLALKKIDSEDWNDKVDGIHMIANLSSSNPKQVTDHMHEIVVALLNECKNLRSSVSRVALWCTGVLTENVKGKMDTELDKLCAILMHKAGDVSNAFIREDAHEALEKVVKYASAGKALSGIISAGSKSKNNTIRASCASFVCNLVGRMGSEAVLNSADQVAKLIPQVIAFCKDPNPVVRQHGKQILLNLSQESCFDRMLKKHVSDADYRTVKGILSEIEKKGGIDSLDSTSISLSSSLSRNGSVKKAVPRKLPDNVQLDLDEIRTDLTAAGWERRLGGLKRFDEMCVNSSRAVASDTKLIEAFMARLNDINSKVSLEGMDTYLVTLPIMSKLFSTEAHLKAVLNQLILALMSHLSSKSDDHKHLAQTCLQETVKQIEPACLSPALAAATKKANVKQKPFMLNIFNRLNQSLYHSKPKQVEVVALPILWDSIRCGVADPESKKAVTDFAKGLVKLMGERVIMDHAAMELDPPRRKILESLIR